jgi:hypothetical protein
VTAQHLSRFQELLIGTGAIFWACIAAAVVVTAFESAKRPARERRQKTVARSGPVGKRSSRVVLRESDAVVVDISDLRGRGPSVPAPVAQSTGDTRGDAIRSSKSSVNGRATGRRARTDQARRDENNAAGDLGYWTIP